MTIDINQLEMRSSSKFYLFSLRCTSQLSGSVIALWHTFGHPLYEDKYDTYVPMDSEIFAKEWKQSHV